MIHFLCGLKYKALIIGLVIIFFMVFVAFDVYSVACFGGQFIQFFLVLVKQAEIETMTAQLEVWCNIAQAFVIFFYVCLGLYWLLVTCYMVKRTHLDGCYLILGPLLGLFLNVLGVLIYQFLPKAKV